MGEPSGIRMTGYRASRRSWVCRYQTHLFTWRGCGTPSRTTVAERKLAWAARPRALLLRRRLRTPPRDLRLAP